MTRPGCLPGEAGSIPVESAASQGTDCTSRIHLELSVDSPELRGNSLHTIETLIASLGRFRDGLRVEAQLRAAREDGSRARHDFARGAL